MKDFKNLQIFIHFSVLTNHDSFTSTHEILKKNFLGVAVHEK